MKKKKEKKWDSRQWIEPALEVAEQLQEWFRKKSETSVPIVFVGIEEDVVTIFAAGTEVWHSIAEGNDNGLSVEGCLKEWREHLDTYRPFMKKGKR